MTSPSRLNWSRGYIDQAMLDFDFSLLIYDLINKKPPLVPISDHPEHYYPVVYAYCQQSVEKAMKALLLFRSKKILSLKTHNPMIVFKDLLSDSKFLELVNKEKKQNAQSVLGWIDKNKRPIETILKMAPGANHDSDSLHQRNTEYPFIANSEQLRLPCQDITQSEVGAAIKTATYLVPAIHKYLEAQNLAPAVAFLIRY